MLKVIRSSRITNACAITARYPSRSTHFCNNRNRQSLNKNFHSSNRSLLSSSANQTKKSTTPLSAEEAQRRAYEHYRKSSQSSTANNDRNIKIASYMLAVAVGTLGAAYASVPLYKLFCQATGFGGTTQRVSLKEWAENQDKREESGKSKISQALWDKLIDMSNVPEKMLPKSQGSFSHGRGAKTWTDEEAAARLASLKPMTDNGRLITVRFDSTVGDVMPWSFVPAQLDVKVVPGETALSFFTAENHSDKAITGVATYNVHPPRAGLYFNKIQCFCFEEQRLLPGETVDMPVFFFIDPEYADDPQLSRVNNITLSYTFFQTDEDDEEGDEDDEEEDDEKTAEVR
jgi:cytochrome c oxidase assembly protein subunit 11